MRSTYWHPSEYKPKHTQASSHTKKLQNILGKTRASIRNLFEKENLGGAKAARSFAKLSDHIILDHIIPLTGFSKNDSQNFALCAAFTYGSGYLAPFDPLDIILLHDEVKSTNLQKYFNDFLYYLWSAGFRIRVKIISLKAFSQQKNYRAAPEHLRFIFGKKDIFLKFQKENISLFQEKCSEIITKRLKSLYTPKDIFPFPKESENNLCPIEEILEFDFLLNFLPKNELTEQFPKKNQDKENENYPLSILITNKILLPKEIILFRFIWRFLWTVRFHLHYLTNKTQNNLITFLQPLVAAKMKYSGKGSENYQSQFMRHYFFAIRGLERLEKTVGPTLFAKISSSSPIANKLFLPIPKNNIFQDRPITILRTLEKSSLTRKALHPEGLGLIIRSASKLETLAGNPEAARIFLNLLRKAPLFLGKFFLNETGILSAMIRPWRRFYCATHISSQGNALLIDQEILNIVNVLALLENNFFQKKAPLASKIVKSISEWKALYLAALLQKIGEASEIDNYVENASIAKKIAKQLGLSEAEQETVYWLILHREILYESITHTGNLKQKIHEISRKIQSPNRLKLIYLLTVIDILALRNDLSVNWDESILQKNYFRLCNRLRGNLTLKAKNIFLIEKAKKEIESSLNDPEDKIFLTKYLKITSYDYWSKFIREEHQTHFQLFKKFFASPLEIQYQIKIHKQETVISIIVPRFTGILTYLTKRLREIQVNINYAEFYAFSSIDAALFVLHSPWYGGIIETVEESIQNLTILLKFAFDEDAKDFRNTLKRDFSINFERTSPLSFNEKILSPARLYFDNNFSDKFLFIEINGRDSKGCLSRICATFLKYKMYIKQANIRTYGVRITNIFHVTDEAGNKFSDQKILAKFEEDIISILDRNFDS
ncbi:hypothetical protein FAI40_09685 [Acetobacteraceae bacterium]|nr:hypothetical protein FAI40_09685 [Acetobacteraceae bacterium]